MKDHDVMELHKEVDTNKNHAQYEGNFEIEENINLQRKLYNMLTMSMFDFDAWMQKFDEYETNYSRFFYSDISRQILEEKNDNTISQLLQNISIVISKVVIDKKEQDGRGQKESIDEKAKVSLNKYQMIVKLYDHCHLANKQREAYKATREEIEKRIEEIAKKEIKEYEKNITSQLIGLVAMFTALSFLLFGGISSFGNIFQMLNTASLSKILILSDVWLLCMFNLFTLFIKMIAMITNKKFEITSYVITINIALCAILAVLIALPISLSYIA